jgi:thiol-disulfide isomerase/thioredoxin
MKKIFALLCFISSIAHAQFIINGTLTDTLKTDWVLLYHVNGTQQQFVKSAIIKNDSLLIEGKKQRIGRFQFEIPADTEVGSYRVRYNTSDTGFVNFIFNKENISFSFHPKYPEETILFSESKENIVYASYLNEIAEKQQKLDSIQIAAIKNPKLHLKERYKRILAQLESSYQKYVLIARELYVFPFVKASFRTNPSEIKTSPEAYMSFITTTFFNNINFSDSRLLSAPFLIDKITDYIFYINYSDNKTTQQILYKKGIATVLSKIKTPLYRKEVIEFLIAQFETTKNIEIIDFIFENHYNKLPKELQSLSFKNEKKALLAAEVGRIAPDFSWTENGQDLRLSTLTDAPYYLLLFWSTDCGHCLREIPELQQFLQDKEKIKVIAFSMENSPGNWETMKMALPNWHHILGLNKWENKIANSYNIHATPNYFILDENKKIISKPEALEDLKAALREL